jgi:hypothetical protein
MKFSQAPSAILMVRPAAFGFNTQTASSNAFQDSNLDPQVDISRMALAEFDRMVDTLRAHDVEVIVISDTALPEKPDAVFPNNWISFHSNGQVCLYPMLAPNRRLERMLPVLDAVKEKFEINTIADFTVHEKEDRFLEGTGSVVFDYQHKIAYACRSSRTHEEVLGEVCQALGFRTIIFDAVDEAGQPIYHTNVLMCVGKHFAVLCLDAIKREEDQETLLSLMAETNHQVVAISYPQLRAFAGNMIEVVTQSGEPLVLLSESAFTSLLPGQIQAINKHAEMLPLSIQTIEKYGGGSVRCMVAGIFCPRR